MIDLSKNKRYPISRRENKVTIADFPSLDKIVETLDTPEIDELAQRIKTAAQNKKQVICMMGGHVIKEGMSPYLIDLMSRDIITHIAMNGGASIHDFEIALFGFTSEYVEKGIKDGSFGMAEETGRIMNIAIKQHPSSYGKAIGEKIHDRRAKYSNFSIIHTGYKLKIPVTVHVTIGADIIHMHKECDPAAIGQATHNDFKIFTRSVSRLEEGVILNIGSAVVMPEVFLKAITIARNQGYRVDNFTAANLDMLDHYRTRVNVCERPTSNGGLGIFVIGDHKVTIPSLYKKILETK